MCAISFSPLVAMKKSSDRWISAAMESVTASMTATTCWGTIPGRFPSSAGEPPHLYASACSNGMLSCFWISSVMTLPPLAISRVKALIPLEMMFSELRLAPTLMMAIVCSGGRPRVASKRFCTVKASMSQITGRSLASRASCA